MSKQNNQSNVPQVFDFDNHQVRTLLDENNNPLFVAIDVANALGYKKPENAIARHCKYSTTTPKQGGGKLSLIPEPDLYRLIFSSKLKAADVKGVVSNDTLLKTAGGKQTLITINEQGLYELIFASRKKQAVKFRAWVTGEILPQLRRTGSYTLPAPTIRRINAQGRYRVRDMVRTGNWNMAPNGMTAHSVDHNLQTENDKAHNVVRSLTKDNEFWANDRFDILTKKSRTEIIELAAVAAKDKTGRSMQKKQAVAFFREAVINLEGYHTSQDVLLVVDEINRKLDKKKNSCGDHITPLRIDVHRDEGHFIDKNGVDFYPGINIFEGRGKDKDKFFLDQERTKEVKAGELEFKPNYHAHIIYTHFDFDTGRSAQLGKSDIQNQHKIAAEVLGLEMPKSGKERADAGEPTAGMNTKQLRAYYAALRAEKIRGMGFSPTTYEPNL